MSKSEPVGLGLIGCGAFGLFCLDACSQMPEVRIAAVADVRRPAADALAEEYGVPAHYDPMELIAHDDVDLVHVATPPASHYELVMAAVKAGKHVLCEKPLAISIAQADEMLAAAAKMGVIVPVDFILRYNAAAETVARIIDTDVLGTVLSGRLTNCAGDTPLGPGHWFWDKSVSGGIFIEHGVHFFDLYESWLGPGEVIFAHTEQREGTTQEDRVMCTIRHERGAVVSHYHGFDQVSPMDRTDHRLVCEMGDICVEGWIPLAVTVDAAVDHEGADRLAECCDGADVEVVEVYDNARGQTTGRGKPRQVTQRIRLRCTPDPDKQHVYAASFQALLADQVAAIRDPSHVRRITEKNGRRALALAEAAATMAQR